MKKNTGPIPFHEKVAIYILSRGIEELGTLTSEAVAEALGVPLPKLLKTFAVHQHITLDRFIMREKIHRAIFTIDKDQAVSLESLSGKLGFKRMDEFETQFRNYLHIAPHLYKEIRRSKGL